MNENTFNEIADLALRETGQAFQTSKKYLMEARLAAISRRESFATMDDLAHCLKARPNNRFKSEVAAALTDKLTRFFADPALVELLATHALPQQLAASKAGRLRVWCAGVATGQEAYSLAMRIAELDSGPMRHAKVEIVATDVSSECLVAARNGVYGHFDVQKGLSIHRLMRYFSRQDSGDWLVNERIRSAVRFQHHNLLQDADKLGQFDVIICRNVLRGMGRPMQKIAAATVINQLSPGGLLFTGPDEDLSLLHEGIVRSRDIRGAWQRRLSSQNSVAA